VVDEDIEANLNLTDADEDDVDPNDDNGTDIDDLPPESPMGRFFGRYPCSPLEGNQPCQPRLLCGPAVNRSVTLLSVDTYTVLVRASPTF
jgi:hypothetical protein